jgi:hypothetical protein
VAALAHFDLLDLPIALFPYELHAERIWALRENLSTYDAWYVALAGGLGAGRPPVASRRRVGACRRDVRYAGSTRLRPADFARSSRLPIRWSPPCSS